MKAGILVRPGSPWIGAHWSDYNQRLCINLLPFVTVWICTKNGNEPQQPSTLRQIKTILAADGSDLDKR